MCFHPAIRDARVRACVCVCVYVCVRACVRMKRSFDLCDCLGGELIEVKTSRTAEPEVVEEVVEEVVGEVVEAKAEAAEAAEAEAEAAGCTTPDPNAVLPPQFAALVALIGSETQTETEADELEGGGATPDPNDVLPPEYSALADLINEGTKERPQAVAMEPKAVDAAPRRWGGGASPGLLREDGGVIAYMQSLKP